MDIFEPMIKPGFNLFIEIGIFKIFESIGEQVFEDEHVVEAGAVVEAVETFRHRQSKECVTLVIQEGL